jgi:hypothetical protein
VADPEGGESAAVNQWRPGASVSLDRDRPRIVGVRTPMPSVPPVTE